MLDETLRTFLAVPRVAHLATLGVNSYPHVVPIWFVVDGDDILFQSERRSAKARNALARPQGAVSIGGELGSDTRYLIRGDLSVVVDVGHAVTHQLLYRYETKARAAELAVEWANEDIVVIRLKPIKITRME